MNFLDIVILSFIVIFGIIGAYSGLLRQLATPAAFLGAWLFSWILQKPVGELLKHWFANEQIAGLAANTVSFAVMFLLIRIIFGLVNAHIAESTLLKPGNRALGAFLGLLKGAVLGFVLVLILLGLGKDNLRKESVAGQQVHKICQWFADTQFYKDINNAVNTALAHKSDNPGLKDSLSVFWNNSIKTLPQKIRNHDQDVPSPTGNTPQP